jgi:anti-sigma factor RsiW
VADEQYAAEPGQRCVDFVEMITAYLDRTLTDDVRRNVDEHVAWCAGCRAALVQWRTVASLAGQLTAADVADIDPYVRDRLMTTFLEIRRR